MRNKTLAERLENETAPIPEAGCLIWLGGISSIGYAEVRRKEGRLLHRIVYEMAFGPIPDGLRVLHKCDVRCCINPDHLFLGTQGDNMMDKARKLRGGTRKLMPDDVRAIRADSRTHAELSKAYGVHWTTIRDARTGKNWSWVY